jgi:predicted nucleic acid-binding protein
MIRAVNIMLKQPEEIILELQRKIEKKKAKEESEH